MRRYRLPSRASVRFFFIMEKCELNMKHLTLGQVMPCHTKTGHTHAMVTVGRGHNSSMFQQADFPAGGDGGFSSHGPNMIGSPWPC